MSTVAEIRKKLRPVVAKHRRRWLLADGIPWEAKPEVAGQVWLADIDGFGRLYVERIGETATFAAWCKGEQVGVEGTPRQAMDAAQRAYATAARGTAA